MSIKRITLSVSDKVAARIKQAAGRAPVSTWVAGVIEQHLEDTELRLAWEDFVRDVAPSPSDKKQADVIWNRLARPTAKKKRAA